MTAPAHTLSKSTRTSAVVFMALCSAALWTVPEPAAARAGSPKQAQRPPQPKVKCGRPNHAGGNWPTLNHDLHNTRHQERERAIGAEQARSLKPAWTFSVAAAGATGSLQSTPILANGCVYVSASVLGDSFGSFATGGAVFALNADTGELVWRTRLNGSSLGLAAAGDLIYALPSGAQDPGAPSGAHEPAGAHAVALDARSGEMLWVSERLDDAEDERSGDAIYASPVVFEPKGSPDPLFFVPLSIGQGDGVRVPLYFLDGRTGQVVKRFFALPGTDYEAGYGGAGIWGTAAFDRSTNHLYAGTADSEGYRKQHDYNNAIVKIDADPRRASFGSVVDAYQGTSEHYDLDRMVPGWQNNPVCEAAAPVLTGDVSQSLECLELDLDFGASPNLYSDGGDTIVAGLQKSGVLHAVRTETMEAAWRKVASNPQVFGNAATGAIDGNSIFVRAFPGNVFSFGRTSGSLNWLSNAGVSSSGFQPLTIANGVLYTITDSGQLVALEAETGTLLLKRPISIDAGQSCFGAGAGVAVARNTVYAPCDAGVFLPPPMPGKGPGALVAYRPAAGRRYKGARTNNSGPRFLRRRGGVRRPAIRRAGP